MEAYIFQLLFLAEGENLHELKVIVIGQLKLKKLLSSLYTQKEWQELTKKTFIPFDEEYYEEIPWLLYDFWIL